MGGAGAFGPGGERKSRSPAKPRSPRGSPSADGYYATASDTEMLLAFYSRVEPGPSHPLTQPSRVCDVLPALSDVDIMCWLSLCVAGEGSAGDGNLPYEG